jgi:hypothetical protein
MSVARHFGSGVLVGTPVGTNQTPVEFGVLQEVSVDFTFNSKPLVGQYQLPVAMGRGVAKITGSAKFAELNGPVFSELFFASVTPAAGQDLWSYNETGTIGATPYQLTAAHSATWSVDLGVKYAATGVGLTEVASSPTTGQYSVAAGVYTFAAADTGKAVLISYTYTQTTSGSGSHFTITNPLLGYTPNFQIDFYQQNPNVANTQWSFRLYSCISTKLSIASKLEDWLIPSFDFEAFTNAANQLGTWNTAV